MEEFEFYANLNGVIWYKCRKCQYKTRGKPEKCPVCGNLEDEKETDTKTMKSLDDLLGKYEELFRKYGGNKEDSNV